MRVGVVTFPGTLDDVDAARAVKLMGGTPIPLWHASDSVADVDAVILPGGFSYGDYLRCGAIARFSPVMGEVIRLSALGLPVLGVCNGFQVLCEAHLLPGALIRNAGRTFTCRRQRLTVGTTDTVWTSAFARGEEIEIVLKNGEGSFTASEDTLRRLEDEDRVVFRYVDNPNGSAHDIAGLTNDRGNVVGLMPHPEHNVDPLVAPTLDGQRFFTSLEAFLQIALAA
ncbi:MAG: phosphoribosylformylglycinamidine synthase subunit PurQ [Propionibacteriaceae bacterium]|jgi:phosphoribosylformylglycinamidine synthase|nr:phosphoribosylformylglycinamidine synthase subunit PurQ [Propionibacteriaceae bacterium]